VLGAPAGADGQELLSQASQPSSRCRSPWSHIEKSYGVATGQAGRWQQILCSQDAWFGGWDGAGNAFYEPWTQADGRIYINVPQWSVTMFRLL
jgi:1,4-alpha-glucan branching enzyme